MTQQTGPNTFRYTEKIDRQNFNGVKPPRLVYDPRTGYMTYAAEGKGKRR